MLLWIHLHKDYTSHIRVSKGVMVNNYPESIGGSTEIEEYTYISQVT